MFLTLTLWGYGLQSPLKSRRLRYAGHVARMEEGRSAFKILTGKRPIGRPRRRWEGNIRIHLKEIGINMRNWVDLTQDRESPCECGIETPGTIIHGVS